MKKRILITGSRGFIATNFLKYLDKYKWEEIDFVWLVDKVSSNSNGEIPLKNIRAIFSHSDIKDIDQTSLKNLAITHVIDFASESHVDTSLIAPNQFFESNVRAPYSFLQNVLNYQNESNHFQVYLNVNTDEVYGSLSEGDTPFTEESPFKPNNPYSATKAATALFIRAMHKSFGLKSIITHCCNNFGAYQNVEKLIPKLITNAFLNKKIPIYGDGLNRREWIPAEIHCDAIYHLLNAGKVGESYNIGGLELTNLQLVNTILTYIRDNYSIDRFSNVESVSDRVAHDFRYALNSSKLVNTGWRMFYPFDQHLFKTIDWYYQKVIKE